MPLPLKPGDIRISFESRWLGMTATTCSQQVCSPGPSCSIWLHQKWAYLPTCHLSKPPQLKRVVLIAQKGRKPVIPQRCPRRAGLEQASTQAVPNLYICNFYIYLQVFMLRKVLDTGIYWALLSMEVSTPAFLYRSQNKKWTMLRTPLWILKVAKRTIEMPFYSSHVVLSSAL